LEKKKDGIIKKTQYCFVVLRSKEIAEDLAQRFKKGVCNEFYIDIAKPKVQIDTNNEGGKKVK